MYRIDADRLFDGRKIYEDFSIVFDSNGIHYLGEKLKQKEDKFTLKAEFVTPGFVDLASSIGLKEESLGKIEGNDMDEATNPQTPELLAIDGVNSYDPYFLKAIKGGVTRSLVLPGFSNSIGGRGAYIFNSGEDVLEMTIKSPLGMRFSVNTVPKQTYTSQKKMPMTRMGNAYLIREALFRAKEYKPGKEKKSLFMEALQPVLQGKDIAFFSSFRADDIMTSVRISEEFKLRTVITNAFEADIVADEIRRRGIPVAFGPTILPRDTSELKHLSEEVPVKLIKAGVEVSLISGFPLYPAEYLRLFAGLLVKHGIDEETALKTITSNPASFIGCRNGGVIKVGKLSDIVIFDGPPWETKSRVKKVFVRGKEVYRS